MACRLSKNMGSFLVVALVTILVLGGILAACSKAPTSTSVTTSTTTSTSVRSTTSVTTQTATSVPTTTTTTVSAPATTAAPTSTTVSAADFYKANIVTVIVPYAPGGGVDYAGRLLANFWKEVTGGRMVVDNRTGGGGLIGANYTYAAKPDGLTMGIGINDSTLIGPTLGQDPALRFDIKKMQWIGYTNPGEPDGLTVGVKSPYNSMQDLMKVSGLKFAATGRYDGPALGEALVIELFGLKDAKLVLGYGGASEVQLAVAKGEADVYTMAGSVIQTGVTNGMNKKSLLTLDSEREKYYYPDAPVIPELLKLPPQHEQLLETLSSLRGGQVYWYQPGVPQDRIDFVRAAFDKIVALPEYQKLSATKWQLVPPISGKNYAAEMAKTLAAATPEKFNELKALADKYIR